MIEITFDKTHIALLMALADNERILSEKNGRPDLCRAVFEDDNIPQLRQLVKAGLVIKSKNLAYNQRRKYHIPASAKMSKHAYGLTEEGREALFAVLTVGEQS